MLTLTLSRGCARIARLRAALVAVPVCVAAAALAPSAAAAPSPPRADPFYAYAGSLARVAHGTVLRTRSVTLDDASLAGVPLTATQVLYRTTNELGEPSATVTTIIRPVFTVGTRLIAYQTAYDGLADTCRPSYQLRGGVPVNVILAEEAPALAAYLEEGYTVVTSDYEGPSDDAVAGLEEGRNTLDGILAAEHALRLPASTKVGMVGYSGGSVATEWAAELQQGYAPSLNIIGVAAGGVPADLTHNVLYINGSSGWAGAIPVVLVGLMRAYKLKASTYLSARGMQIARQVSGECLVASAYPGLTVADMFKHRYEDPRTVPALARILNGTIMGRTGTPHAPLLLGVGESDGTGDGVMIARDVQELAYEYCRRGVNVELRVYAGDVHTAAALPFEENAMGFFASRFVGVTPHDGCGAITPGNSLAPLPIPKAKTKARSRRHHA